MEQGSVLLMVKHLIIVKDEIPKRPPKKGYGLGVEQQEEEHDLYSTQFVVAVAKKVLCRMSSAMQNKGVPCDVTSERTYRKSEDRHRPFKELKKIVGGNSQINACTHNQLSLSEDKVTVLGTFKLPVKSKADVEYEHPKWWKSINRDYWGSHHIKILV